MTWDFGKSSRISFLLVLVNNLEKMNYKILEIIDKSFVQNSISLFTMVYIDMNISNREIAISLANLSSIFK